MVRCLFLNPSSTLMSMKPSPDLHATVLLTPRQMALVDSASIAAGTPGHILMENAGKAVADAVRGRWTARQVLVLCGPGNNGGDGFVVARHLQAHGWPVTVSLYGNVNELIGDAAFHAAQWQGAVLPFSQVGLQGTELVIDALFGAGLAREVPSDVMAVQQKIIDLGLPVCAVDMPSGVDGLNGQVKGLAIAAAMTVTFFKKKPGHVLQPGRRLCGHIELADIGIADTVLDDLAQAGIPLDLAENDPSCWLDRYPWHRADGHKYDKGHVLVAGGAVMTGAARLAATACARVGAGLVTVAAPSQAWPVYASSLTSIMVHPFDGLGAFCTLLKDERRNVVLVGPGAGLSLATEEQVLAALATGRGVVLDADAISAFASDPQRLFDAIRGPCIMTPHEGEFARLFPDPGLGKLDRARNAARLSGAVIVLKGSDTVIAAPDGRAFINANAPATLATGGTGDVLAGLIAGLLAQGMPALYAAAAAVWLHGDVAGHLGPGLMAEDLPAHLPDALHRLQRQGTEAG
jgi:hydroxyethylthiazole kinase-like uncharacterized protein yjeF